jgi:predicted HTH transcriptional regulator
VVINALVHADYSQRGAPTRIAFFDNRIEVENPGILLPGMTIEDMKQGISKIRNPVLARIFRELGLIEQWGSGVRRIIKEAEELGLPEPEIVEIGMRLRFIVPLAKQIKIQANNKQSTGDDAPAITTQSPTQSPTQSDDPVIRLIRLLPHGPLSSGELRRQLNLKHRATFRKNYLHTALKEGYIEMTIPDKPNSRMQKYRLTQKGTYFLTTKNTKDTK